MQNSLMQRLNSQEKSSIILAIQRLHEADLVGELIMAGDRDELKLSAIDMYEEMMPLGAGHVYRRRKGCALHPSCQSLVAMKKTYHDVKNHDESICIMQTTRHLSSLYKISF